MDDNDVTQDIPDDEQMHTTGTYLDMKQKQCQIRCPPENLPNYKQNEFTLQLDDNDVTQDVPDEEQLHTTGSSYCSDTYLDMKQKQSQIRRYPPEIGRNLPNHKQNEFTLQLDDDHVTQDVPGEEQMCTTCSSYSSDAYLDTKQQQTQLRRATYCATGYISTIHNA